MDCIPYRLTKSTAMCMIITINKSKDMFLAVPSVFSYGKRSKMSPYYMK